MHLLVDVTNRNGVQTWRARCGVVRRGKTADLSGWSSDITCESCRG